MYTWGYWGDTDYKQFYDNVYYVLPSGADLPICTIIIMVVRQGRLLPFVCKKYLFNFKISCNNSCTRTLQYFGEGIVTYFMALQMA